MVQTEALEASTEGRRLKLYEHAEIVGRYNDLRKQGRNHKEACKEIAPNYQRSWHGINYIIRRYQPTTDLAQHILRASAARLAIRIVRKANVTEAMELLSNKSLGVLAPKSEAMSGQAGFFLSVSADSCGAVKVGVQIGGEKPQVEAPKADILECNGYTIADEPVESTELAVIPPEPIKPVKESTYDREEARPLQGHIGKASRPESQWSEKTKSALQAARNRIKKARVLRSRAVHKQSKAAGR